MDCRQGKDHMNNFVYPKDLNNTTAKMNIIYYFIIFPLIIARKQFILEM